MDRLRTQPVAHSADHTRACCREQDKLLPLIPFKEQAEFFRGDLTQNLQRLGGAVLVTVLASVKAAPLAAGSLTFPLWWPWLQAALKNNDVKSQYPCAPLHETNGRLWSTRGCTHPTRMTLAVAGLFTIYTIVTMQCWRFACEHSIWFMGLILMLQLEDTSA